MSVAEKLKDIGSYVRKGWRSTDPDSYYQYRRGREANRKQAEQVREDAERHGEQERAEAKRGREYEARYSAERAAEKRPAEAPRGDTSHPE